MEIAVSRRVKRAWTTAYLALLLLLTVPLHGQDTVETRNSLSGLTGVMLQVVPPVPALEDRGITAGVIEAEVVHHLKEADIPVLLPGDEATQPGLQTLYVEVMGIVDEYSDRCTWSVRLDLVQTVRMERVPDAPVVMASTWSVAGVAYQARGWREGVVADVGNYTERFVEAFAAANPGGITP